VVLPFRYRAGTLSGMIQASTEPYDPLLDAKAAGIRADLRAAESTTNREPTKAQIRAENYAKGEFKWQGLTVRIENPRGSVRSGVTKDGQPWSRTLRHIYGHLCTKRHGRSDADGDGIDIFVGDHPDSALVGVIDQFIDGKFDEVKCVIGCLDAADAERVYLANYQKNWDGCGGVTLLTAEQFKSWAKNGDTGKPLKGQDMASFHKTALDFSEERRKPIGYDADGNMVCGDGSIFATREEMEKLRRPAGARLDQLAVLPPGITVEPGNAKAADDRAWHVGRNTGEIKEARTGFHRPENFDLLKEHSTEKLKVEAGCNDWESAWTGITFTFPDLGRQVWAHLTPPATCIDSETPSKDLPPREEIHDWQDKLVKAWLSAAKELARQEDAKLHPEHFLQAAKDTQVKQWVEAVGENRMKWDPVKQASVAPPAAQPEVQAGPPRTGPEAILHALQNLDLDKLRADSMDVVHRKLKSKRPAAVQILGYLEGLKRAEIQPHQLMISRVPVLPPQFRPFSAAGEAFIPGDANELYRDLFNVRSVYEQMRERLGEEGSRAARLNLYDAMSAVYGFGEPVSPKTRERGVTGFLKTLTGSSPKFSLVQRNLLSKDVDYVGRGTIGVDPDLGMDEVGIPDEMAWKLYAPFIQRRLVRAGMSPEQAVKQIKDRTKEAEKMMDGEMAERPVMYSRAPSWHKFNFVAGMPKRRTGSTIMVNPFVTTGLNADFDGDCGRFVLRIKRNVETVAGITSPTTEIKLSEQVMHIDQMPRIEDTAVEKSARVTEWDVPAGTQLYAIDLKTGQHAWADVTKVSLHRNLVAYTVQLACGEMLVVSEDHSVITYNPATGALEKTKPADGVGQFVPRATRMSTAKPIEQVIASREGHEWKLKLTRDVGVFLGLLAGDGCMMGDHVLALYGTGFKAANRAKFTEVVQSGALPYGQHVGELSWVADSLGGGSGLRERSQVGNTAWFSRWLQDHIGHGALNKRVPAFSLQAGPEHLMGVLDGLLSSDGSVSVSRAKKKPQLLVNFSTSSPDLGLSIQEVCRLLGVATHVTPYKSPTSGKDAWIITLSTVGLKSLVAERQFTLTHPEKNRILQEHIDEVSTNRGGDVVPYPLHLHKLMQAAHVDHTGGKKKPSGKTDFGSLDQWKMHGVWSRGAALQWMDAYLKTTTGIMNPEPFMQYRSLMADRSLRWERVEKADRMHDPMDMWDVTIPGPYTFATSSGLFVQDTVAVHLPIMDATVSDAKNKLMPSKMLLSPKDRDKVVPGLKQEQILGLHNAQARPALAKHVFPDERSAMMAIRAGKVRMSDEIEITSPA